MLFGRFIRILKANLNSEPLKKETKTEFKDTPDSDKTSKSDPMTVREAEYYANLELKPGSDFSQVKASYKRLMKQYHPDMHVANEERRKAAELITSRLNEAYKYFEVKFNHK